MNEYMQNKYLDVVIAAIINDEVTKYREELKEKLTEHFNNPYCACTDMGKVIFENEIVKIIDSIEIGSGRGNCK